MTRTWVVLSLLAAGAASGAPLRVQSAPAMNAVAVGAAELLKAEGLSILVDGGDSAALAGLADRSLDVALSTRPPSDADRLRFPKASFVVTEVGREALALVVSTDVYNQGIRILSRPQIRELYEGKVRNWKRVNGPDRRVAFFDNERGGEIWEIAMRWLYGDPIHAPRVTHPQLAGSDATRETVESTAGAASLLALPAEGSALHAVAIRLDDGTVARPVISDLAAGSYPLSRPLLVITNGPPAGGAKKLIDLLLSARGQALLRKQGQFPVADLRAARE